MGRRIGNAEVVLNDPHGTVWPIKVKGGNTKLLTIKDARELAGALIDAADKAQDILDTPTLPVTTEMVPNASGAWLVNVGRNERSNRSKYDIRLGVWSTDLKECVSIPITLDEAKTVRDTLTAYIEDAR